MQDIAKEQNQLIDSYAWCEEITKKRAKNFYHGIKLLPPARRKAMCAVYAFFRDCDDITDDEGNTQRREHLEMLRRVVLGQAEPDRLLRGLPAFLDAVERYAIPRHFFAELIDGMLMDLDDYAYRDYQDTYKYCYCAASTVGYVCVHIFGFDERNIVDVYRMAEIQGQAFQLTNILRDLHEDSQNGRCYLPASALKRWGVSLNDIASQNQDESMGRLYAHFCQLTESYYRLCRALPRYVAPESRACLKAMTYIYHGVLKKITKLGPKALRARAKLNKAQKLGLVLSALAQDGIFLLREHLEA